MLQKEDEGINLLLSPFAGKQHFQLVRESYATTESLADSVLNYCKTLTLFHFSGHADQHSMVFTDQAVKGKTLAELLQECKNLKLVFLNGCSTREHIKRLSEAGVKAAIIATSTPINDRVAKDFSIELYHKLANQVPLLEAINTVRKKFAVTNADITIEGIDRGNLDIGNAITRNQWYAFCPDDQTARWQLPTGASDEASAYKPNVALRKALFDPLYKTETFRMLFLNYQEGKSPTDLVEWVNDQVLRWLPYPLAEPLRVLLCPQKINNEWVPVRASEERLGDYIRLFDRLIDLLMSVYLAQIRDRLLREDETNAHQLLPPELKTVIHRLLRDGWKALDPAVLIETLRTLETGFDTLIIQHVVPGIPAFVAQLSHSTTPLNNCLQFMGELRQRLSSRVGLGNVVALCQLGEDHLTELLKQAGFLANYRLQSYKHIRAIRFYGHPPRYQHEKVVLQIYAMNKLMFGEVNLTDLWECQSVLLVRTQRQLQRDNQGNLILVEGNYVLQELDQPQFLNLSPFIIDGNVFKKSDNFVADLYGFLRFENDELTFEPISRTKADSLMVKLSGTDTIHEKDYTLLREQVGEIHKRVALSADLGEPLLDDDVFILPEL